MAKTYNRMLIDVNTKPTDIITEVQQDANSRYLDVFLYDNGVPIDLTGHEVRIYMRKPDSTEIWNDGEITEPTNGRCQFLLTTQALARTGVLHTQISIWKDDEEILSTQIFDIMITESLRTTGSIESSNEYGALVVLFQNLYQSMDLMTDMVQNFGAVGEVAQARDISTFWQGMEYLAKYMDTDLRTLLENVLANASVQGVLDKIGDADDTGGSETEGTVMGKENRILEEIKNVGSKREELKSLVKSVTFSAGNTNVYEIEPGYKFKFLGITYPNASTGNSGKLKLAIKLQHDDVYSKTYNETLYNQSVRTSLVSYAGILAVLPANYEYVTQPFVVNSWFNKITITATNTGSDDQSGSLTIYVLREVD